MLVRTLAAAALVSLASPALADGRVPPTAESSARLAAARVVGVLPPAVVMLEWGATLPTRRPDWEETALRSILEALREALSRRGMTVRLLAVPPDQEAAVADVSGLLRAGAACYAPGRRPHPACLPRGPGMDRVPGVGSIAALTGPAGVDAVVVLWGRGVNATDLRKIGSFLTGAETSGTDRLQLALVTPAGSVDWLAWYSTSSGDLRDPAAAARAIETLLEAYPALPPAGEAPRP